VNDFNAFGRTWQVLVQAEPDFRSQPSDINRFFVRNGDGNTHDNNQGNLKSSRPFTDVAEIKIIQIDIYVFHFFTPRLPDVFFLFSVLNFCWARSVNFLSPSFFSD